MQFNSHVVTRFHSKLMDAYSAGHITAAEGLNSLIAFAVQEALVSTLTIKATQH